MDMNSLASGDLLDHYRIEETVARSGLSVLYRATDHRTGRQVAIKVPIAAPEADAQMPEAFQREQAIALTLDHPGLVKIFEAQDVSRPYLVMEWADGQP